MSDDLLVLAEQNRLQGILQEAFDLISPLAKAKLENALVQFEMGSIYDAMSREAEAIPYKEKAISTSMPDEKRCAALLFLGSHWNCRLEVDE